MNCLQKHYRRNYVAKHEFAVGTTSVLFETHVIVMETEVKVLTMGEPVTTTQW